MTSIAVIGCGGIGCRHVQALGRLARLADIYAVDISAEARTRAVALFKDSSAASGSQARVLEAATVAELPRHLDIVILATRAAHRIAALQEVLEGREVRQLILEKFLFARRHEFAEAAGLLNGRNAWVNCPRRLYPGYRAIQQHLVDAKFVQIHVTGSARIAPIGTIGIHFADLLDFFCKPERAQFTPSLRDASLVDANRGLLDFAGSMELEVDGGRGRLRHDALSDTDAPHLVTILSDTLRCVVHETAQRVEIARAQSKWIPQTEPFEVPVQSMLTHHVAEALLLTGRCDLTPYERSAAVHIGLFDTIMTAYRGLSADPFLEALPFT